MRHARTICGCLAVCATLTAQTQTFTAPPGHANQEGESAVQYTLPFANAVARHQYVYGGLSGTPRPNLAKLEARRDGTALATCPARTAYVAVLLSHADLRAQTNVFANNYKGTPTVVFARKLVNLPDHTTPPAAPPAPWTLAIPFDTQFSFSGNDDLLVEFQLDSNSNAVHGYSLDAVDATPGGAGSFQYIDTLGSCTTPNGKFWIFGRTPVTAVTHAVTFQTYGVRAPGSAAGVLALGLKDPDLRGLLCAPLRTSAEITLPLTSDAAGNFGSAMAPITLQFPFPGPMTLYTQFAALDATQSGLPIALSDAVRSTIVPFTPGIEVSHLYDWSSATAVSGTRGGLYVPVLRLSY